MTEYLIVGDVHGDLQFAMKMCKMAESNGIDTIIQVGDFKFWDHTKWGVEFLDSLNENSEIHGVKWVFLPGNHENFDSLEEHQLNPSRTEEGFVMIRDRISYTGKVSKWVWEGVSFKAVGGAYSIDKGSRIPLESWWPQETLTAGELLLSEVMGPADVLLTHDCPTYAPFSFIRNIPESHIHRQMINRVVEHSQAKVHFHGHMHDWYDYINPWGGQIYGLECNDAGMNSFGKARNHVILNVIEDGNVNGSIWYDVNTKPYFKDKDKDA